VNFLIREGRRATVTIRYATDNIVRGAFNTWFSSCRYSLEEVREAQHLDNAIEEDDHVYHARRRHARDSDDAGLLTG
jgi:hypothetical protein